jgi:ABC-type cobalt transport system, permease component CbiQ and related transporters
MHRKSAGIGHAYQFRSADSAMHRLPSGWKLALWFLLSISAIIARDPWALSGLLLLNGVLYFFSRLTFVEFWQDIRFFLIQMVIVVGLYMMRQGVDGFRTGMRISIQILLFFLPGAIFLRTTPSSRLMRGLRRILPFSIAFAILTSFRFVPYFAREFHEIALAQRLRGARVALRQCFNPFNWKDIFSCIMIPLIIRAIKTANESALSAEARGFGGQFPRRAEYNHLDLDH